MPPKGYKKNPISPTKSAEPAPIVHYPSQPTVVECRSCKFYDERIYTCHRYPKQSTDFYPIKPDSWCGEYVKK